jgi:hypothetical protein
MFGINKKNVFDFVEDTITINKDNPLKGGVDFEIVSIDVITDDLDVYTAGDYFNVDLNQLVRNHSKKELLSILENLKPNNTIDITSSLFCYGEGELVIMYKMIDDVDIELAQKIGLGVARMLKGKHKGELFIFNPSRISDDEEENTYCGLLMVKIYVQLKYKDEYDDPRLERFIENNPDFLHILSPTYAEEIKKQLEEVFMSKKGGNNVVPFKRR